MFPPGAGVTWVALETTRGPAEIFVDDFRILETFSRSIGSTNRLVSFVMIAMIGPLRWVARVEAAGSSLLLRGEVRVIHQIAASPTNATTASSRRTVATGRLRLTIRRRLAVCRQNPRRSGFAGPSALDLPHGSPRRYLRYAIDARPATDS